MPITIDCPSCSRKLRVPDDLLGKQVKCPTCNTTFTATEEVGAPAAPPPEEPDDMPSRRPAAPARRPAAPPPDEYADTLEEDYDQKEDEGYERPRRRRRRSYVTPHRGSTVLALGIISLVLNLFALGFIGLILGPIAWSMGNSDMQEIRAGRMDPEGEGTTNAGRICGMIGTCLGVLNVLACCSCGLLGALSNNH